MTPRIEELRVRLLELNERADSIAAKAEAEKRDLSPEEQKELDDIGGNFDRLKADLERLEKLEAQKDLMGAGKGRQTTPTQPNTNVGGDNLNPTRPADRVPAQVRTNDGNWGWRSLGEYAAGVRLASSDGGHVDPRLVARLGPSTYSSEGVASDGGYAVPPDFRATIMQKVMGEDSLLSRTDKYETASNTLKIPKDETTPWGTSGIQAYWDGENATRSQSKVALEGSGIKLHKLTALVPVTEELLEDAPALDSYLRKRAPEVMGFKLNQAIVSGNGAGMPLGITKSPSLVTISKKSGQAADTIVYDNIVNMWARLPAASAGKAVWLGNQDILPQLMLMTVGGTSSVFGTPAYLPPGGASVSPYGTLMGRPIVITEACAALGDKGDLILADMTQYLSATKVGGIRSDVSIHLWFDCDIVAYKFTIRVAGQPWWSAPISRYNSGAATLSPFVTIEDRT